MEAGNRCFDMRVPEEINRRIVDHTSDINLTYSSIARDYLLREGLPPDQVIKTGSPMLEVLSHYRTQIDASNVLQLLELDPEAYFVVSAHREENIQSDRNFAKLVALLNTLADEHDIPVIVSTHPRTQNRIDCEGSKFHPQVRLLKPLGFHDYNHLQLHAKAVLSDSGTITEEASILNFPALNLREAHERPEGMEEAAVMMVGLEIDRIRQGLAILASQPRSSDRSNPHGMHTVTDYSMPNVSAKVLRIIHSYTDYVNRVVWKKY
jgi:UDP-N-acetylglucosamine 2-epimerase (non-hydrolysing)